MWRDGSLKLVLCLTLLVVCCTVSHAQGVERHALLIGIDDYSTSPFRSLQGAGNDISLIRDVLVAKHDFKPKRIRVLLDEQATHIGIRDAFRELQNTVAPGDFVYIHYSGHGSSACDVNGDEKDGGQDSTWVPYGSRSGMEEAPPLDCALAREQGAAAPETVDLNRYDILDDELNLWMANLNRITDNVVFVSDSCHSGTVSKSLELLPMRGVVGDSRVYPELATETAPLEGVRISACRDDEKTGEFRDGDRVFGIFTWFWAKALTEAGPSTSWQDLVKRAAAFIEHEHGGITTQHPQVEGDVHRHAFGEQLLRGQGRVAVTNVVGSEVTLGAGLLSGVTVGSSYFNETTGCELVVRTVDATSSAATSSGRTSVGDLFVLKRYQPEMAPLRVCVRTTPPMGNREHAMAVRAADQPGYVMTGHGGQCDLVLQLGKGQGADVGHCRILRDDGEPYFSDRNAMTVTMGYGWESVLYRRLAKMARLRSLLALRPGKGRAALDFEAVVWRQAPSGGGKRTFGGVEYSPISRHGSETVARVRTGDVLTFVIRNEGDEPYFCYLVGMADNGIIQPLYPLSQDSMEAGRLRPGATLDSAGEFSFRLDEPGREYVRFIASREPVDVGLLSQEPFVSQSKSLGSFGRWTRAANLFEGEWTTDIIAFDISPR